MAMSLDGLGSLVQQGFQRASISTVAGLRDDDTVRAAARHIYDVIPFPVNLAVKMSVGVEGLERFALVVRDKLLAAGVTDISRLGQNEWRALLASSLASVPTLGRLFAAGTGEPAPAAEPVVNGAAPPAGATGPAPPRVWYLRRQDAQYGPWPDSAFIAFAEQGRLDRGDLVWRDGFPGWIALEDLPKLSGRLSGRR